MAGGPAGLPRVDGVELELELGLGLDRGARIPRSRALRLRSICGSGRSRRRESWRELGGILGSSLCVITPSSELPSASPGSMTLPEPPPAGRPHSCRGSAPLGLVGIVAGPATAAEDRRHLVRVSHLLLGLGIIGSQAPKPAGSPQRKRPREPNPIELWSHGLILRWRRGEWRVASDAPLKFGDSIVSDPSPPATVTQWLNRNSRLFKRAQKRSSRA